MTDKVELQFLISVQRLFQIDGFDPLSLARIQEGTRWSIADARHVESESAAMSVQATRICNWPSLDSTALLKCTRKAPYPSEPVIRVEGEGEAGSASKIKSMHELATAGR